MRKKDFYVPETMTLFFFKDGTNMIEVEWNTNEAEIVSIANELDMDITEILDEPDALYMDIVADTCFGEVTVYNQSITACNMSIYDRVDDLCFEFQRKLERSIDKIISDWAYEFDDCEE